MTGAVLRLSLSPSRHLAGAFLIAHAAAAGLLLAADLAPALDGLLGVAIAGSLLHCLLRFAWLRSPSAIIGLEIHPDGRLSAQKRSGSRQEGRLLSSSFVSAWLTVLNLKLDGTVPARSVVIAADSMSPEDFRRLRVWLRWKT